MSKTTKLVIRDNRTQKRFFVDNAILDRYGKILGPHGISTYCALCKFADLKTQECWPSYQTIADLINSSRRNVIKQVKLMETLRLVHIQRRPRDNQDNESNIFTLLNVPGTSPDPSVGETLPGAQGALGPSAQGALPSAQGAPKQSPINNPKGEGGAKSVTNVPDTQTAVADYLRSEGIDVWKEIAADEWCTMARVRARIEYCRANGLGEGSMVKSWRGHVEVPPEPARKGKTPGLSGVDAMLADPNTPEHVRQVLMNG